MRWRYAMGYTKSLFLWGSERKNPTIPLLVSFGEETCSSPYNQSSFYVSLGKVIGMSYMTIWWLTLPFSGIWLKTSGHDKVSFFSGKFINGYSKSTVIMIEYCKYTYTVSHLVLQNIKEKNTYLVYRKMCFVQLCKNLANTNAAKGKSLSRLKTHEQMNKHPFLM